MAPKVTPALKDYKANRGLKVTLEMLVHKDQREILEPLVLLALLAQLVLTASQPIPTPKMAATLAQKLNLRRSWRRKDWIRRYM